MLKLFNLGLPQICLENEGGSSAAPADPGSVLFPNEGGAKNDGTSDNSVGGDGNEAGKSAASEWKEYVADPSKNDDENAAAKAEHDKTKPADDKAKAGDKEKAGPENEVPADGKYSLRMPDGVEVDAELAGALGPVFKDIGLTRAQAQKLSDVYAATLQARVQKQTTDWAETVDKWATDAKADKDIGGDKWDATVTSATRAVSKLGTPALREYLNVSGGGNHPELIRFMSKVGALIREDDPAVGGTGGASAPATPAYTLYPNDKPKD